MDIETALQKPMQNRAKEYQKYLKDLDEWEKRRASIIGNAETEGTLTFFQSEQKYKKYTADNHSDNTIHFTIPPLKLIYTWY